jgi:beta-phosphoglucomutase-like phosphatase (HAD superfamily)
MTRQGILWDMDGVLVDTGDLHYQAWSQTLSAYGIPFNHELFRTTFGMNNAGILTTLLEQRPTPELLAEISERKEQRFRQAMRGRVRPLPGVLEWLERLKGAGIRQAIASSAPPANQANLNQRYSSRWLASSRCHQNTASSSKTPSQALRLPGGLV